MLKNLDSNLSKQKIILFIPFTASENNFSLYMRALDWRYNLKTSIGKSDKTPEIVIYRHPDENEEDYEYYDQAQFNFTQENLGDNAIIYILADGTGDPDHVININQAYYQYLSQEPYELSIHAVAWRMKQCGLTPELAQNTKAINLFICDENDTNDQLAVYFAQGLGQHYKDVTINYYSATVHVPMLVSLNGVDYETKKLARFYSNSTVKVGYAHEHKHTLKVRDALMQKESPHAADADSLKSKARALPMFRELTSAVSSLIIEEISDSESTQNSLVQEPQSIIFLDEESDIEYEEVNLATLQYQQTNSTQSTALVVRQDRSIISFFKYVHQADKKDKDELRNDLNLFML
ncbi:hypothetical protein DGG96_18445 [Legionella qingyii]|uniref:Uncharacterized protein n=1 Tax=Legionella qingyii TaxID=2184757 RepID=A0A317TYQ2_9GAMM|nr:hypothetical protein [Legionella qingyii]PWY54189.1 hypothetical protein DGG96_18445 [Legionella qingyii]RUR23609.1 hypothetical protein ELY16_13195 [Legionella qingyii]RUR24088.1 hypothetical protein ELY20_05875 [Legionella qingyii]